MSAPTRVTVVGTLPVGVEVDGVRHREFEIRGAIVQDNVDAITEVGTDNSVLLSAAIYARQLLRLGTLSVAQISTRLICGLSVQDFNELERMAAEAEKKARLGGSSSLGGSPAEPRLPAMASPSITP